eukprot:7595836-Alexandrium_andersonii.AAC.1
MRVQRPCDPHRTTKTIAGMQRLLPEAGLLNRPQSTQPKTKHARTTAQSKRMLRRAAYMPMASQK